MILDTEFQAVIVDIFTKNPEYQGEEKMLKLKFLYNHLEMIPERKKSLKPLSVHC